MCIRDSFYIDKTALVYQLVKTGSYYFLSRPRRFGKSLLISTLEAYFQGKRELFEGLAMEKLEKDWVKELKLYVSTGATAKEIAVFEGSDSEAAGKIEEAAKARIEDQTQAFEAVSYTHLDVYKRQTDNC